MKLDWETALKLVDEALEDNVVWNMARSYAESNDGNFVKTVVATQYQQASEGVDDFDMTVEQYLFARLEEEDAENEGFYWVDEIERWLKLDVNK